MSCTVIQWYFRHCFAAVAVDSVPCCICLIASLSNDTHQYYCIASTMLLCLSYDSAACCDIVNWFHGVFRLLTITRFLLNTRNIVLSFCCLPSPCSVLACCSWSPSGLRHGTSCIGDHDRLQAGKPSTLWLRKTSHFVINSTGWAKKISPYCIINKSHQNLPTKLVFR